MAEPRQHQRVAAYAICRDEAGRILLCRLSDRTSNPGWWTLPGGGVEFGEAPVEGVIRELAEETGLVGVVERLVDVRSESGEVERGGEIVRYHAIRVLYDVSITGGQLRDETDESTDAAAWFTFDEARGAPLRPMARDVVRMLDGR